nr:39S ribosomal protein L50, mitochondrial [Onthophagus taurus]
MAATLVRHALSKIGQLHKNVPWRSYATKAEKKKGLDRKVGPKIDSSAQSLATKGFLRSQKDYNPPNDLNQRLNTIITSVIGSVETTTKLNTQQKFVILNNCCEEFQHSVPNSLLHKIETVGDVYQFYGTPISTTTPLDKLKTMELPPNLHIQYEYHRYHPDTDTKFGGQTAYPRSSTIVTGLKYKDKYPGHVQNQTWPYNS